MVFHPLTVLCNQVVVAALNILRYELAAWLKTKMSPSDGSWNRSLTCTSAEAFAAGTSKWPGQIPLKEQP